VFEGGFVHQHELRGVRADGVKLALPACLVCLVKDGKITRLDEYFDSARVAEFRKFADTRVGEMADGTCRRSRKEILSCAREAGAFQPVEVRPE
jgi:hypothetical protein